MIGQRCVMGSAGRVVAELWTPGEITTALWLDASDSGTITITDSKVSQWNDKSGNAKNATQTTALYRPVVVSAAMNNKDVLDFSADLDDRIYMDLSPSSVAITTDMLVAVVFTRPSSGGVNVPIGWSNAGGPYAVHWNSENVSKSKLGGSERTHGTASTATGSFIDVVTRNSTNTLVRRNGTQLGATAAASTVTGALVRIGAGNSSFNIGRIAEVIVCQSAEDVEKIEGYLAHKWGLASSLPSGHTYKNAAPTV